MAFSRRSIHTVLAKSEGERFAHAYARHAFLQRVGGDLRTRALFASWGASTGLDEAIVRYAAALDLVVMFTDVSHRSQLHRNQAVLRKLPSSTVANLANLADRCDHVLHETRDARAAEVIDFVRHDLLHDLLTRICAWLADDLMTMFDAEVLGLIWCDKTQEGVPLSPMHGTVPKGHRPKRDGEHIVRNVNWFYRAVVAARPTSVDDLAKEWVATRAAQNVTLQPRDEAGISERPDTKLVRTGIADARRLLELSIPPQHWPTYADS